MGTKCAYKANVVFAVGAPACLPSSIDGNVEYTLRIETSLAGSHTYVSVKFLVASFWMRLHRLS